MKVLIISNYKKGTGGISGQVELLQQNLIREGISTDIFNTEGSIWRRLTCRRGLLRAADGYDVFHIHCCSHWGFLPAVVGITVGKKLHKRIVLTYHGGGADSFFRKHTQLVRHFLLQTDTNIVLSGFLGKVFDNYNIPYTIIPNVIELDESNYRTRPTIHPHFISIRTLSPLYNIECILRAFKIVKEKMNDATLTIVGDGPSRESLEEMVQKERIPDVRFTGRVDNRDIYHYLDDADVMLSSPVIDNMPVSLLEGCNAGLLVISSNVGGVPYMIEHGKNGLLFESNNEKQLADLMLQSVNKQDKSKLMITLAHGALKRYSWSEIKNNLLTLYH